MDGCIMEGKVYLVSVTIMTQVSQSLQVAIGYCLTHGDTDSQLFSSL